MAGIRNLLGKEFKSSVSALGTTVEPIHDGKVWIYMDMQRSCCCQCANTNCICRWCVPCGVTKVTFEIWGGGGGGAGACCCMNGIPGTTGAYSRKTLTYPDIEGGYCYSMCVATATSNTNSFRGRRGCSTYITGPGLSNFCAEGGYGGCSCCGIWSTTSNYSQDCITFASAGGDPSAGDCLGYGPPAYGGDENIRGRSGWIRAQCQSNCAVKAMLPYPPRLIDHSGGWTTTHYCTCATCGEQNHCFFNHPWSGDPWCYSSGIPGFGNASGITCQSSCVCGTPGSGGMIRITYCSCWMGVNENCSLHMCN